MSRFRKDLTQGGNVKLGVGIRRRDPPSACSWVAPRVCVGGEGLLYFDFMAGRLRERAVDPCSFF